jgi:hypothetical protein
MVISTALLPLLPQKTRLPQHGGVIPIDALTGEFVAPKLHDHDKVDSDLFMGRGYFWQEPIHRLIMGERDVELIHELLVPDHTVCGCDLDILGP